MRKPIIAGNWKMNLSIKEAIKFVEDVKTDVSKGDVEPVIAAPFTFLKDLKEAVKSTNIKIAAQNMHFEDSGAFTGEVSAPMLKEIGVDYCVIGHSERRQYFAETDETINKKLHQAFKYDIVPILCVGETLEEREQGKTNDVVKSQVIADIKDLSAELVSKLVIAYEPIWAIGTGKTATADQANEVISYIRSVIKEIYNDQVSENVRIQYGGSVKPENVEEIMGKSDIDGALVGGASLKASDFIKLVNF